MNPIISIIVPAYNEEENIVECLESLLNQTFKDIEILCVDDNSSDSTFDVIQKMSEHDSRIIPLKNTGKGVASARNFGLNHAKGEYIGFVDSDDTVHPQMYEILYRAIKENNVDLAHCRHKSGADIDNINHKYVSEIFNLSELSTGNEITVEEFFFGCIWNKLIKKDLIGSLKFDNYSIGEDTRFCVKLIIRSNIDKVAIVPLPLYNYRVNLKSLTNTLDDNKMYQSVSARFECYELLKEPYKRYSYYYLEQGFLYTIKYKIKYGFKNKEYKKKINRLFKKYISLYLKSPYANLTDKLYVLISYYFTNLSKKIYK